MVQIMSYGPWAVVTGASSGLGRAVAEHLAAAGFDLVLAARSTEALESLGAELAHEHGTSSRIVTVDLGEPDAATRLLDATADLDVGLLVSNAGAGRPGRLLEQPLEALHQRLALNATSHLDLVHGFGPRLAGREQRSGIILVSAFGAQDGIPNMAHEAASKAYVRSLGLALHDELVRDGIDVTVVQPGNVDTPVIDAYGLDRSSLPLRPQPPARAVRSIVKAFLAGRAVHVPGRRMALIGRLTQRSVSTRMNGRMMGAAAEHLAASGR